MRSRSVKTYVRQINTVGDIVASRSCRGAGSAGQVGRPGFTV